MAALLALSVAACDASDAVGTVGGQLPPCYGPGPDMNLTPNRTIEAFRDGHLVKSQTFRSDIAHLTYELELPPGRYEIKAPGIAGIPITVEPHRRATLDLPLPTCL